MSQGGGRTLKGGWDNNVTRGQLEKCRERRVKDILGVSRGNWLGGFVFACPKTMRGKIILGGVASILKIRGAL